MVQRISFWALFALTLAVYVTMLSWSLPTVGAAAGGLPPFDMRPGGYDLAAARAFVGALSPDGAAFYLAVQQRLDLVYPALLSLTLFFATAALLPRRLAWGRYAIALPALAIAVFDYLENHAVAGLIAGGLGGLDAAAVAEASRWTTLKSGLSTVVMSDILVLLMVRLIRAAVRAVPGLRRRIAAHPVLAFLALGLGASWAVQVLAVSMGAPVFLASAMGVVGLAGAAILVTAAEGGRAALGTLLESLGWRTGAHWHALAALALPLAVIAASPLAGAPGLAALPGAGFGLLTGYLPELLVGLVCVQLWEELAWTGFLQRRLEARQGLVRAALTVAPAFALSHLALDWMGTGDVGATALLLGLQLAVAIPLRLLVGAAFSASGSVIVAATLHAALNASNSDAVVDLAGPLAAAWFPLAIVALAGLAIAVGAARAPRGGGAVRRSLPAPRAA